MAETTGWTRAQADRFDGNRSVQAIASSIAAGVSEAYTPTGRGKTPVVAGYSTPTASAAR